MLVEGLNDGAGALEDLAAFLAELGPSRACLSVPTRPPAETWVRAPGSPVLRRARARLERRGIEVEPLTEFEGDDVTPEGSIESEILAVTSVHPLREDALRRLLDRAGVETSVLRRLVERGEIEETVHGGHAFYRRPRAATGGTAIEA
jgi:wyosine [tRNA(Phe)-imidazoG37] synthetase (radical SAM superfamily)